MGTSRLSHCASVNRKSGREANARGYALVALAALSAEKDGAGLAGADQPPLAGFDQVLMLGAPRRRRTARSALRRQCAGRTAEALRMHSGWRSGRHGRSAVSTVSRTRDQPTFSSGTKSGAAKFSSPSSDQRRGIRRRRVHLLFNRGFDGAGSECAVHSAQPDSHRAALDADQLRVAAIGAQRGARPSRGRAAPWSRNPADAGRTAEARSPPRDRQPANRESSRRPPGPAEALEHSLQRLAVKVHHRLDQFLRLRS